MSDNDDEDDRLDRAKRIRRMREGGRDDANDAPDQPDDGTDGGDPEESPPGEDSVDDDPADEDAGNEDTPTDADETAVAEDTDTVKTAVDDETTNDDEPGREDESEPAVRGANVPEEERATDQLGVDTEESIDAPLPEADELEEALEEADADSETDGVAPEEVTEPEAPAPGDVMEEESEYEEDTRVLEFALEDEHYCLDIEYIEEIVKEETITRVPNTPEFVEGVVDLRGQITTIINPKVTIGKDNTDPGELIVVFDAGAFEDQGHIGWVVDDVRQVSPITDSEVNDPPVEEDYINGVIDREDDEQFVIWTTPDMAFDEAETA